MSLINQHLAEKLVVSISSRALFDLEFSHKLYESEGLEAYCQYQIEHEDEVLEPGAAYNLVRKLLSLKNQDGKPWVEVILLSRNSADTGLRVFNSIAHYGLNITRAAFTNGKSPYRYIQPFQSHLFLSVDPADVYSALQSGFAAATILPPVQHYKEAQRSDNSDDLRIAFDGDAVIFSDSAEQIYQQQGLDAFTASERRDANTPLPGGPFKTVLAMIHKIQSFYPIENSPIRTALMTARSAPAHERVIRTLREWDIRIDEAVFLGGLDKGEFLKTFGADIFFDDQQKHCDSSRQHVPTGHVPSGISNKR